MRGRRILSILLIMTMIFSVVGNDISAVYAADVSEKVEVTTEATTEDTNIEASTETTTEEVTEATTEEAESVVKEKVETQNSNEENVTTTEEEAIEGTEYIVEPTVSGDLTWSIDSEGLLSITGEGDYRNNLETGKPEWVEYADRINSAVVDVTGITTTASMFENCYSLTSVDLTDLDTSKVTNMTGMFWGCMNLTSIDMSGLDTSSLGLNGVQQIFHESQMLKEIKLPASSTMKLIELPIDAVDEGYNPVYWKDNKGNDYYGTQIDADSDEAITLTRTLVDIENARNPKKCGDLSWYIDEEGCLYITGNGDYVGTRYEYPDWNIYSKWIKSATVNITNITSTRGMFMGCCYMTDIDLSNLDTSKVVNMDQMFQCCSRVKKVDMSGFDTSSLQRSDGMFDISGALNQLVLPKSSTLSITVPYMASDFSAVTWSDGETTYTSGAISASPDKIITLTRSDYTLESDYIVEPTKCGDLTWSIDLNGLLSITGTGDYAQKESGVPIWTDYADDIKSAVVDVTGINHTGNMFNGCTNLKSVDLTKLDTTLVTSTWRMFYNCTKLESVDVSGFNTSKVIEMGYMFDGCESLTSLDISNFDTIDVTHTAHFASNCWNLQNIILPRTELAFDVPYVDKKNNPVTWSDGETTYTSGAISASPDKIITLTRSDYVSEPTYIVEPTVSGDLTWSIDSEGLLSITGEGDYSYDIDHPDWAANANDIKTAVVDVTGITTTARMFANCDSLTSVDLTNLDTSNVTDMSMMFNECKALQSVDLSNFDTSKVTNMISMFYGCTSLENLDVSSFDTSNIIAQETDMGLIGGYFNSMFCNCESLTSLDISNFVISETTTFEYITYGCKNLQTIVLPKSSTLKVDVPYFDNFNRVYWEDSDGNRYTKNGILISANPEKSITLTRHDGMGIPLLSECTDKATEVTLDDEEIHLNNSIIEAYYVRDGIIDAGYGHYYKVKVPANTDVAVTYRYVAQETIEGKYIVCAVFDDSFANPPSTSVINASMTSELNKNKYCLLSNDTSEDKYYYIWMFSYRESVAGLTESDDIVMSANTVDKATILIDSATLLEDGKKYTGNSENEVYVCDKFLKEETFVSAGKLMKIDVASKQSMTIAPDNDTYIYDESIKAFLRQNSISNTTNATKTYYIWVVTTTVNESFNITATTVGDAASILNKATNISLSTGGNIPIDITKASNYVTFADATRGVHSGLLYKVESEGIYKVKLLANTTNNDLLDIKNVLIIKDSGDIAMNGELVPNTELVDFPNIPIAINTNEGTHYILVEDLMEDGTNFEWTIGLDTYSDITTAGAKTLTKGAKYTFNSSDPKMETYYNYTDKDFYLYKTNIAAGEQVKFNFEQNPTGITAGYTAIGYIYDDEGNIIEQRVGFEKEFSLETTNETASSKDYYIGFYYFGEAEYGIDTWSVTPNTYDAWVDSEVSHNNHIIEIGQDKTFDLSTLTELGFKVNRLQNGTITNATISGNTLTVTDPKMVVKYDYVVGSKTYNMQFVPYQATTGEQTPTGNVTAVEDVTEDEELGGTKVVSVTVNDEGEVLGKKAETTIAVGDAEVVVTEDKDATGNSTTDASIVVSQTNVSKEAILKGLDVAATKEAEYKADSSSTATISKVNVSYTANESSTTLGAEVFEKVVDTGISIELTKKNAQNKEEYSWTFRSDDITDKTIAVNPKVEVITDVKSYENADIVEELTKEGADNCVVSFEHEGNLPGKATVKIDVSDKFSDGEEVYFYYLNPATEKLTYIDKLIVTEGYIAVDITHCSDYVLTNEAAPVAVTGITFTSNTATLTVGDTSTLKATVSPSNATNKALEWKSSKTGVARVDSNGKVTAVAAGTTTITCTAKDGSGKSATCTVTVKAKPVTPIVPEPPVTPAVKTSYRTHVQSYGWQPSVTNGAVSGTSGESKRLEAINISLSGNDNLGVEYTTHVQSYGWLPWVSNGELSGTEGESKRLEAIEIKLTGADKDKYDIYYCVHAQSYGWLNWAKNGEPAGTAGFSKRLEAIKIIVVKKGEAAPVNIGTNSLAYVSKDGSSTVAVTGDTTTSIMYKTHVQSYGWQAWKYNGATSGTVGKSKRLEGININVVNKSVSGGIKYSTHVQSYGWQDWKYDGAMSGTSGESKRLEAIKIELTSQMKEQYDVYYRVHAQTYGWLDWAKNGEEAGTAGLSRRLEGIDIVLVPKGGEAPGTTEQPFIQKK